eukprot:COSAG01_NODE_11009_length_2028_cov_1.646967_2_plen_148_part_00
MWYQDARWKEYRCPLGLRVVDFADEPQFGRLTMYLKGREWLDEKDKVVAIAGELMPETYVVEGGQWVGKRPPSSAGAAAAPWFVKESDKVSGAFLSFARPLTEMVLYPACSCQVRIETPPVELGQRHRGLQTTVGGARAVALQFVSF